MKNLRLRKLIILVVCTILFIIIDIGIHMTMYGYLFGDDEVIIEKEDNEIQELPDMNLRDFTTFNILETPEEICNEILNQEQDNPLEKISVEKIEIIIINYEDGPITLDEYAEKMKNKDEVKEEGSIEQEEEEVIEEDNSIAYEVSNVNPYEGYFTKYMDLQNRKNISVDDMRIIISNWTKNYNNSEFIGTEEAFIKAAKITGYDPIFLFALAGMESGWNVSELHSSKNNPYSINMIDSNPYKGYEMGDDFSEGIVNGAIWIYDHYYEEGQTTLYDMIYGKKKYSSSEDHWINSIVSIMDKSYKMI